MENIEYKKGITIEMQKTWLVPLLCLVVIFGAVAVFPKTNKQTGIQTAKVTEQPTVAVFSFDPSEIALGTGEKATVDFYLDFNKEIYLDGIDVLLTFDPEIIEVTEVSPGKTFSYNALRKDDLKKGRVSMTFLEEKGGGSLLKQNNKIFSVTLTGKKAGETNLKVIQAEKGATTVITERGTSKKIIFDSQDLGVVVE